jgi:hypothetical protein
MSFIKSLCLTINRESAISECAQNYKLCVFLKNRKISMAAFSYFENISLETNKRIKNRGYFVQDSVMVCTAQFSITPLEQIFGKCLTKRELWPPRLSDFNLCEYYYLIDTIRQEFT